MCNEFTSLSQLPILAPYSSARLFDPFAHKIFPTKPNFTGGWSKPAQASTGRRSPWAIEDILAVWLISKEFITRIEAGYDRVHIFYRYPIDTSKNVFTNSFIL